MQNRIITVSRQFGSGGRTIARMTAKELGIPCYDQELIEKIAEKSGFTKALIAEKGEHAQHGGWFANAFVDRGINGISSQDYLWGIQRGIILELALKESCVIVGRCADYILKDTADCLTVFIHAGMEERAERIVKQYGESGDSPMKRLRDKDKRRSAYYHFYTGLEWGSVQNYHITLDSGAIGIEKCVEILVSLAPPDDRRLF